jgi:hypothetical protein
LWCSGAVEVKGKVRRTRGLFSFGLGLLYSLFIVPILPYYLFAFFQVLSELINLLSDLKKHSSAGKGICTEERREKTRKKERKTQKGIC